MNTLITGITGMVGTHWALRAQSMGWTVFGIDRSPVTKPQLKSFESNIFNVDILDSSELEEVFINTQPDVIIHLAAQSFNAASWKLEELTHNTNYLGTLKILQAARRLTPKASILLAGSSVIYGMVKPSDCPLEENRPMRPVTPYAVTKAGGEFLGFQYQQNYGMKIFLPRFFNLLGDGHSPGIAVQSFARQLARIAKNIQPPVLKVGNLDAERDFLDIKDAIQAMLVLIQNGEPGIPVNICSGKPVKISTVLQRLIEVSGLSVEIQNDSSLMRPSDEPLLFGDNSRICNLGWKPKVPLDDTLKVIYKDWLDRVLLEKTSG